MAENKGKQKKTPLFFHEDPLFMNTPEGRDVRVLSEMMGPEVRLGKYDIQNTVAFAIC